MVLPIPNQPPMMGPPVSAGPPPMGPPMGGAPSIPLEMVMQGPSLGMPAPPPGSPPTTAMGMMGLPGFPPGVVPDMNYPGSEPVRQAEMMLAMQDPTVALALIQLYLKDIDTDPGPKYPAWFRKEDYAAPTYGEVKTWCEQDREDYTLLIERMRRDREVIQSAVVGVFNDFDPESEEVWRDTSLALDFQLIVSILSACHFLVYKNVKKSGKLEEAQQIENLAYAMIDWWSRRYESLNSTLWQADLVKIAMQTGHLVTRVLPNFNADEGEIPLYIDTLDPSTCFFQFDSYGIYSMSRIYHQPLLEVCHGFRLGKDAKKKLMTKEKKDRHGNTIKRRQTDPVEVYEYWNRRYYSLQVDNEEIIKAVDHQLGRVPVILSRSSIGDAGALHEVDLTAGWGIAATSRQRDLANKGQSHVQYLQIMHKQREAVMGIVATEIQKIKNPPKTVYQDPMIDGDAPDYSEAPGAMNILKKNLEELAPVQTDSRVSMLGPMVANISEQAQRGMLSAVDHGAMPGSQTSGNVVEGLSESSKDKFNLWKLMAQNHVRGVLEMGLTFIRDHGRKMGQDGKRGEPFTVERQNAPQDEDGFFEFDYKLLHDYTTSLKVEMTSIRLQNLGPMGNAVMQWRQQGLMTKVEALEMRAVRDPHSVLRQIEIESFKDNPEYKKAKLLQWMEDEGEDPRVIASTMYFFATQSGGGGGGGAPPPGATGPLPGNGGGSPTVGMPGGPGVEGGRPPQLPGPTPSMPGIM